MRIIIPLTLELELQDPAEREKYLDPTSGEVSLDYLADLFDENTLEDGTTYVGATLLSINGKTAEEVKIALAVRVP